MPIPRDTSTLLSKISNSKPVKKVEPVVPAAKDKDELILPEHSRGRDEAKLRQRAKKAEAELETLKAQNTALQTEVDSLRKPAEQWKAYEHVERQKLLATLPPELKGDAKTMPLNHLRLFTKQQGPTGATGTTGAAPSPTDLDALQKSGDKKAINEYVEKVKRGEITPAPAKVEALA